MIIRKNDVNKGVHIRNMFITILLSALTPGLGHFYCGYNKKGMILYGIMIGVSILFFIVLYRWFYGFIFYFGFILVSYLYCIGESMYFAWTKPGSAEMTRFNRWYVYLAMVLVHIAAVMPVIFSIVSPLKLYRVPTNSMAPTLVAGDYFLVDKRYYENRIPERGDVVVFLSSRNERIYNVKRVVGLPGEKIRAIGNVVFINGNQIKESYPGIEIPFQDYSGYKIYSTPIPENNVYVLGDNRDESYDSRYYGSIKISSLKGKGLYKVWRKEFENIGKRLWYDNKKKAAEGKYSSPRIPRPCKFNSWAHFIFIRTLNSFLLFPAVS